MNVSKHLMFVHIIASMHLVVTNVSVGMVSDGTKENVKVYIIIIKRARDQVHKTRTDFAIQLR